MSNSLESDAGGVLGLQSKRLNCAYLDSEVAFGSICEIGWVHDQNRVSNRERG